MRRTAEVACLKCFETLSSARPYRCALGFAVFRLSAHKGKAIFQILRLQGMQGSITQGMQGCPEFSHLSFELLRDSKLVLTLAGG